MLKILLVSPVRDHLSTLATALSSDKDVSLGWAASAQEALEAVDQEPPHLVVIDDAVADMGALDLVARLLKRNALINTAVVSDTPAEEFHEISEGLGVMAHLSPHPGQEEAAETLATLKRLTGL